MSYARWSSDDYRSDVYVYEDVRGGFTTHVAGRKYILEDDDGSPVTLPEPSPEGDLTEEILRFGQVSKLMGTCKMVDLDLPHDGETYNDETAEQCAVRLETLRDLGYRVPAGVIEEIRATGGKE